MAVALRPVALLAALAVLASAPGPAGAAGPGPVPAADPGSAARATLARSITALSRLRARATHAMGATGGKRLPFEDCTAVLPLETCEMMTGTLFRAGPARAARP